MKDPLVSIIVLNLNGKRHLQRCFTSLKKQAYSKVEVIMVDNGSVDDSIAFVKKNFPHVQLVMNSTNLGFARACNQGSQVAKGKYLFFLNNDATIEKSTLKKLVLFMEKNKKVALVGPVVYKKDKISMESAGLVPTLSGFFYHPPLLGKKPLETFGITGAAMLTREDVFRKIGGFDSDFFIYSEDIDLCTRIKMTGGKVYVLPETKVFHLHGQTSRKLDKSFVVYHATKNRILLLLKNFSFPLLMIILPIHFLFLFSGILLFLLFGKAREAWAMIRGIWWNIKKLLPTLRKRKKIQSLRTVSDWWLIKKYFKILPIEAFIRTGYVYIKFW